MKRKTRALVIQHLEHIAGDALESYQDLIRCYVHNKSGVYALYRNNKLYYVGLATNLNSRLKHHLRDRHAGFWDRFSVYLTQGDEHLREIEALALRIASPTGNRQKGKLKRSVDLRKQFRKDIKVMQNDQMMITFLSERRIHQHHQPHKKKTRVHISRKPILAQYTHKWFWIKMTYKGDIYRAHIRRDGTIKFDANSHRYNELKNRIFYSPSAAGHAVTGRANDGWMWWHFRRSGKWFRLDELRGNKRSISRWTSSSRRTTGAS
ncbi:MAG: GIY-YIG nuclease family protein [Endomicrobiales bacterium]